MENLNVRLDALYFVVRTWTAMSCHWHIWVSIVLTCAVDKFKFSGKYWPSIKKIAEDWW